jgi:hypothetical protein
MTFDEYVTTERAIYQLLASVVESILAAALGQRPDIRLLKLFVLSASTDDEKQESFSALHDGTRLVGQETAEESARIAVLQQSKGIVQFYRLNASIMSNELLSKMEHILRLAFDAASATLRVGGATLGGSTRKLSP